MTEITILPFFQKFEFLGLTLLPFPLAENIHTIREAVGYEVLWLATFVIDDENDEMNISVITKVSKLSYIFLHSWFVFLMSCIYLYVFRMLAK